MQIRLKRTVSVKEREQELKREEERKMNRRKDFLSSGMYNLPRRCLTLLFSVCVNSHYVVYICCFRPETYSMQAHKRALSHCTHMMFVLKLLLQY